jgi:hypothetical protein
MSSKGSQFERDFAKDLSLWWTNGANDAVFWRTSQSGGRSTSRAKQGKKTFGQYGDIAATDPIGRPLLELVTIELKRGYNKETPINVLDQESQSAWWGFVEQVTQDSNLAGTLYWLLIHKRDRRHPMVYLPASFKNILYSIRKGKHSLLKCDPNGHIRMGATSIYFTLWEEFKRRVSPKQILEIQHSFADGN